MKKPVRNNTHNNTRINSHNNPHKLPPPARLRCDGASIFCCGETAIVLELDPPSKNSSPLAQHSIWQLNDILAARELPGVRDIVPGNGNLTLVFDPLQVAANQLIDTLCACWQRLQPPIDRANQAATAVLELEVNYGGEYGPDLNWLADFHGISASQLIEYHHRPLYQVAFLGFQPGFAYLHGLDSRLHTPRKNRPRLCVPANSVAIGGAQTGIYPAEAPGGWHIIGRYCAPQNPLFDIDREPPNLLAAGDSVRFVPAHA